MDGKTYYALTQTEFFITMAGVNADRNQVARGKHYRDVILKTRMARSTIETMENEQAAGAPRLSRRLKNKTARDAAYDWANELLHVVSEGPFWKAFSRAGMQYENADRLDQLDSLYDQFESAPSMELKQQIEELESTVVDPMLTYTAFDGDPRKLKAADYGNNTLATA